MAPLPIAVLLALAAWVLLSKISFQRRSKGCPLPPGPAKSWIPLSVLPEGGNPLLRHAKRRQWPAAAVRKEAFPQLDYGFVPGNARMS
jgi:hypothetical protein